MNRAKVVFVDDEPGVCAVVSKTLDRIGLDVLCFHHGSDCLAYLAGKSCDLLVTDVRMPDMDGMDLLRRVKRQMPWLPVLLVTGYGDVATAVRAMKTGAIDFIQKPLERDTFLHTVQSVLARNAEWMDSQKITLTRTELTVLSLILDGRHSREMAALLHRSPRTIEVHRCHIMQKLGVANVIELLRRATDIGLLQANGSDTPRSPFH